MFSLYYPAIIYRETLYTLHICDFYPLIHQMQYPS